MNRLLIAFLALGLSACNLSDDAVQVGSNNGIVINNATTGDNNTTSTNTVPGAFQVISVSPEDGATGVPTDTSVVITFSDELDANTVTREVFSFTANDNDIDPAFFFETEGAVLTLDLPIQAGVTTEIEIADSVTSIQGAPLQGGFSTEFTAIVPFEVVSTSPAAGAVDVPPASTLEIEFTAEIDPDSLATDTVTVTVDPAIPDFGSELPVSVSAEGSILRVRSMRGSWREFQTLHTVSVQGLQSLDGQTASGSVAFTTGMFEEGVRYRIRAQSNPVQDALTMNSADDITLGGANEINRTEWQAIFIEQGIWQIQSVLFSNLFLEGGDGIGPLYLAAPADEPNTFFSGQLWFFEEHPIESRLPETADTSSVSFFMRTEFQGPMRSLTADGNRPRIADDEGGVGRQAWQFARVNRL